MTGAHCPICGAPVHRWNEEGSRGRCVTGHSVSHCTAVFKKPVAVSFIKREA